MLSIKLVKTTKQMGRLLQPTAEFRQVIWEAKTFLTILGLIVEIIFEFSGGHMAVQALFSGPAGWLTIGMVGLIFVWGGGAIWMLSYARGTFKYNSDLFLRLLLRADKVDKKDEDVIKFMKLIQGHDYGGALNWVVDKKKTKTDTYSHALALEETLTPLGLAGTVLGVFLAFSGPSSAADISKLYPNLGLAIVTTLAGIVMFVVVKIFFESGTTQAYNEMMEAADNLAAAINSNAEWLKDL